MNRRYFNWLIFLSTTLMSACGGGAGSPEGSVITFNPTALSWNNITVAAPCYDGVPQLQQIVVKTPGGAPLNNTTLTVFVDSNFAKLYDDKNNNLLLDADEFATPITGGSLTTKTTTFGTKNVFVAAKLGGTTCTGTTKGLAYTMGVSVFSGNNYGVATYTITSQ